MKLSDVRTATELEPIFVDQSGKDPGPLRPGPAMIVPRASIAREIERLADLPPPGNGKRASAVVHPHYKGPETAITPGIDAVINVLKPGEVTEPVRKNSNRVEFCISGSGLANVNGESLPLEKWDVCNIPAMQGYQHRNTGKDLFVWLSMSNAPLLEAHGVHYFEASPPILRLAQPQARKFGEGAFDDALPSGARLQSTEYLADLEVVQSRAHRWAWTDVRKRLAFAPNTHNREIVLLYNPATERRAGTSASFFVTMLGGTTTTPLFRERWGHRHTSATILYHYLGSAVAEVEGEKLVWTEGDLIMAAPGWARHNIHSGSKDGRPTDWGVFALQDHPLHIALESLVWQDDPNQPVSALGLAEEARYLAFSTKNMPAAK